MQKSWLVRIGRMFELCSGDLLHYCCCISAFTRKRFFMLHFSIINKHLPTSEKLHVPSLVQWLVWMYDKKLLRSISAIYLPIRRHILQCHSFDFRRLCPALFMSFIYGSTTAWQSITNEIGLVYGWFLIFQPNSGET